jgi:hypothetical protein
LEEISLSLKIGCIPAEQCEVRHIWQIFDDFFVDRERMRLAEHPIDR